MFFAGKSKLKAGRQETDFETTLAHNTIFALPNLAFEGEVTGVRLHPDVPATTRADLSLVFDHQDPLMYHSPHLSVSSQTSLNDLIETFIPEVNDYFEAQFAGYHLDRHPPALNYVQGGFVLRLPPRSIVSSDFGSLFSFMGFETTTGILFNPDEEEDRVHVGAAVDTSRRLQDLGNVDLPRPSSFNLLFKLMPTSISFQAEAQVPATPRFLISELENGLDASFRRMGFLENPLMVRFDGSDYCTLITDPSRNVFMPGEVTMTLKGDFARHFEGDARRVLDVRLKTRRICRLLHQSTDLLEGLYPVKLVTESFNHPLAYVKDLGFTALLCHVWAPHHLTHNGFQQPLQRPSLTVKLYNDRADPIVFSFDAIFCIDIKYTMTNAAHRHL